LVAHENQEVVSREKVGEEIGRYGYLVPKWVNVPQGYCRLTYGKNIIPNRFFYAAPAEIASKIAKLVPGYAGLISIRGNNDIHIIKNAPLLHKEKMFESLKTTLLSKFYWLSEKQRRELYHRQFKLHL